MNKTVKKNALRTLVFGLCIIASTAAAAYGGWHAVGWRGPAGGWHGTVWHNNGWNNGWHNAGWYGGVVVTGAPGVGYYAPICQPVRLCNLYGQCWIQQQCN
ncbi:glycine-rich protein [Legionella moravica]|uniref:Glycine-rich protein n=1 Tax=Legionella moravica TaxID=39962 RepID=A0A378JV46_9GAMM|nr:MULTISPECIES: hypothetical protein [Legionella]KTD33651.1 glycine-rich protein [Legionella moravica]RUR15058.1 hypothetical protein ELY21_15095 [Legionella sp. km535]STX62585.1 glycine-rich protein [Legionella moravica]